MYRRAERRDIPVAEIVAEQHDQVRRAGRQARRTGRVSGKKVIEAKGISKAYGGKDIVRNFSLTVQRRDRIAFVGPNGVGKTTLIKMLTGEVQPESGAVTLGTNLAIAVFDQSRAQLDPDMSLWENLTFDPEMRVGGRADQVMVRGEPRHVVGYLKDFLFDEAQARAPVRALSGGEKALISLVSPLAFWIA